MNNSQAVALAAGRAGRRLVLAALLFNLALCFIHTQVPLHAIAAIATGVELLLLAACLFVARSQVTLQALTAAGLAVAALAALKLLNPAVDLKILHDLLVMYVFYELGLAGSRADGHRVLWIAMAAVLAVGLFEIMLPAQFGSLFDVWGFYVDKGVISQDTVNYSNTTSFVSGDRGEGSRTYLQSVLGPHRVSSVFLEPVSMGNFAVLAFAWCFSVGFASRNRLALMLLLAAACVVLSDSRFASGCVALMLAFRLTPLHRSRFAVFALPVLAMLALTMTGALHERPGFLVIEVDDLAGRLLFSGRLLDRWDLAQWLALSPSGTYTADTGYAYVINNLGLPLALLLLGVFAFHAPRTREAQSMKAMIAVYMASSLCIGANMFTIKTAALCWFLYGAANALPQAARAARVRQPAARLRMAPAAWS